MSTIKIDGDYLQGLRNAEPTIQKHTIKPPKGSMAAPRVVEQELPPINTDIQFTSVLPEFKLSKHAGLAAMDAKEIPDVFDWRHDYSTDDAEIRKKKTLIAKPGNQALCGSCWAISGAGIIADNFVVSGIVDWVPNLSTTWSLMAYPQSQCKGGNPGVLFNDVAKGGLASNHCIDYSWCLENEVCNGSALKHFDSAKAASAIGGLDSLIPKNPGCYNSKEEHFLYYTDPDPQTIYIGAQGVTEKNIGPLVKKHIYTNGPAMGGFIVLSNFMPGTFTKTNGGVYLEKANYDAEGNITDWDYKQKYNGSHAIAIMGWGMAKNILVGPDKREDVPYWYCRNSWKPEWGDGGYFKIAMYPWNQTSQFEKIVTIDGGGAKKQGGGIVFVKASKPPVKKTLPQLQAQFAEAKKIHDPSYYVTDAQEKPAVNILSVPNLPYKKIFLGLFILLIVIGLGWLVFKFVGKMKGTSNRRQTTAVVRSAPVVRKSTPAVRRSSGTGRSGNYRFKG